MFNIVYDIMAHFRVFYENETRDLEVIVEVLLPYSDKEPILKIIFPLFTLEPVERPGAESQGSWTISITGERHELNEYACCHCSLAQVLPLTFSCSLKASTCPGWPPHFHITNLIAL